MWLSMAGGGGGCIKQKIQKNTLRGIYFPEPTEGETVDVLSWCSRLHQSAWCEWISDAICLQVFA